MPIATGGSGMSTTLYFSDIVGFTALSAMSTPIEVTRHVNYTVCVGGGGGGRGAITMPIATGGSGMPTTLYFSDIVGFTALSAMSTPLEVTR